MLIHFNAVEEQDQSSDYYNTATDVTVRVQGYAYTHFWSLGSLPSPFKGFQFPISF